MFAKIKEFIKENHMLNYADTLIVGVSGGADSVCLLHILCQLQEEMGLKLFAVHVNHMLRAEEAEQDALFVEELCKQWDIPFYLYKADIEMMARQRHITIEEAGRAYRYECFEKTIEQAGIKEKAKIAVAHHKNDVVETVLFHLIRGSGMKGVAGIAPVHANVLRPLLVCNRLEIEHYLQENGLTWRMDSTNLKNDYARNKIRNQILPALEEINAGSTAHMEQFAKTASQYFSLVENLAKQAYYKYVVEEKAEIRMQLSLLEKEELLIAKEIIYMALSACSHATKDIGSVHVEALKDLFGNQAGKCLHLPYGIIAVREYECVKLMNKEQDRIHQLLAKQLNIPGETALEDDSVFNATLVEKKNMYEFSKKIYTKSFDYDKINGALCIRPPQPEDMIIVNQDGQHKKLSRYFIDSKIPAGKRDSMLVLAREKEVIWVIGMRISEAYKVTEETKIILELEYKNTKE